jgi:taurine dioxygenase
MGGIHILLQWLPAYRAMSPGLQKMLCDLSAWHSDSSFLDSNVGLETNPDAFRDPVLHPVIVKHPGYWYSMCLC